MATLAVYSFEGDNVTGELGGIPGETTTDNGTSLVSDFEVEPGSAFIAGGRKGLLQRVYIEADTQGQPMQVFVDIDGTYTQVGTMTTTGKAQADFGVNMIGYIFGVRLLITSTALSKRVEVSAIEADVYRAVGDPGPE
jgi:hypothetical protein